MKTTMIYDHTTPSTTEYYEYIFEFKSATFDTAIIKIDKDNEPKYEQTQSKDLNRVIKFLERFKLEYCKHGHNTMTLHDVNVQYCCELWGIEDDVSMYMDFMPLDHEFRQGWATYISSEVNLIKVQNENH